MTIVFDAYHMSGVLRILTMHHPFEFSLHFFLDEETEAQNCGPGQTAHNGLSKDTDPILSGSGIRTHSISRGADWAPLVGCE